MNWKKLLICFVVVYVVIEILSYLIHAVWLGPTYQSLSEVWRPEAEMQAKQWIMFVTAAVWAFFFCYIFARGYEGKGLAEGVRYGVIIGLFYAIPQAYESYVIYPIPYYLALYWFLAGLVVSIICGIVVALIYKPADAAG